MPSLAETTERRAYEMRKTGRTDDALAEYRAAAEAYAGEGNALGEAHALRHAGDILRGLRRSEEARECYEHSLLLYEGHPERSDLDFANALRAFALLREQQGESVSDLWERAEAFYVAGGITEGAQECRRHIGSGI